MAAKRQSASGDGPQARVIMLGTGTPRPDPNRCGPAVAVIVNGAAYLVDFGTGVVRQATAAYLAGASDIGFGGVNIKTAFLTHLHSDHTLGLPDLMFTPWLMGREATIKIYGPAGLQTLVDHVSAAWRVDIEARVNGENRRNPAGCRVDVEEIKEGEIYTDRHVSVTAFRVRHEEMKVAFGFRFDTQGRTIVISGDTAPCRNLIEHSRGCDILIHDVYSSEDFNRAPASFQTFRRANHTSSFELAEIAREVRPGLLVLTHRGGRGHVFPTQEMDDAILAEIRTAYGGPVVAAKDLDVL